MIQLRFWRILTKRSQWCWAHLELHWNPGLYGTDKVTHAMLKIRHNSDVTNSKVTKLVWALRREGLERAEFRTPNLSLARIHAKNEDDIEARAKITNTISNLATS